jgi:hypothetical protein
VEGPEVSDSIFANHRDTPQIDPTEEKTPVTDIHAEASERYAASTANLTDDEARELAGAYLDLMERVMYGLSESCTDQITITFTKEKTFLIEPVHDEAHGQPKRTKQLNVRLNTTEHERLEQLAQQLDKSLSDVMREALDILFQNPPVKSVDVNIFAPPAEAVLDVPADQS